LIEVARQHQSAELIAQKVYKVSRDRKTDLLTHLINLHKWYQVLVFTRTKHGADRLSKHLTQVNISALAIHGNKSQAARTRTLAKFKDGSLQVLVATDIAARGIDINELPIVVNFELPNIPEDYVHRIGRTGRAGTPGEALSLVCVDEYEFLADIEKLMKRSVPQEVVVGFEPDPNAKAEPIKMGGRGQPGRQKRQTSPGGKSGGKSYPRSQDQPKEKPSGTGNSESRRGGATPARSPSGRRKFN
jgi:ATP-dependent RNA helicase RhlE